MKTDNLVSSAKPCMMMMMTISALIGLTARHNACIAATVFYISEIVVLQLQSSEVFRFL